MNIDENCCSINMQVRRIGGGFGAKITRSAQVALACALAAHKLRRPVRMVLSLETNLESIGKRDPSYCNYEVILLNEIFDIKVCCRSRLKDSKKIKVPWVGIHAS